MRFPRVELQLPGWVEGFVPDANQVYSTVEERMQLVIDLSKQNVAHRTGGPFGAAIFDTYTQTILAPGVNLVTPARCSVAHAEIVACMVAQQMVQRYDLSAKGLPAYELVTSTEPCAMCFGAILWSGVRRVICGARSEDAETLGFDEGPKPANWVEALASRGISVQQNVLRSEATTVLQQYGRSGQPIYKPCGSNAS
jgi:tRNA(Arg) A34 adenosine deaminase TadA